MPLPKITNEMMEATSISMAENPVKYLVSALDDIHKDNESLGRFLYKASTHHNMNEAEQEAFLRGAVAVYLLLRNQSQADELDKQWS